MIRRKRPRIGKRPQQSHGLLGHLYAKANDFSAKWLTCCRRYGTRDLPLAEIEHSPPNSPGAETGPQPCIGKNPREMSEASVTIFFVPQLA